jgi:hypothetical protein
VARLTLNRLLRIEDDAAKMDAAPAWLTEEHGPSRHWDLIMQALDRFSYATDPQWLKPYVYEGDGNAPIMRLLEHYGDPAIEFAETIALATAKAATYRRASEVAYAMMGHLPNPHQCHMGSQVFLVTGPDTMELTVTRERP